jgi:Ca2+-binding EF-hand superfamily protein
MGATGSVAQPSDRLTFDQAKELLPTLFNVMKDSEGTISYSGLVSLFRKAQCEALFTLWDVDASGFLEVNEFNSIMAMYNGLDWNKMTDEEKTANAEGFLKYYDDNGDANAKLDRKEFLEWLQEEVASFPNAPFDAVVQKLRELVKVSHLFVIWDVNSSGFLEVNEFNSVMALYNGLDWDKMTDKEKKAEAAEFLKYYDDHGQADTKLDRKEVLEWLHEEAGSFPDTPFDNIVQKLTELVKVRNLYAAWDANGSGYLEVKEFNVIMARYNGLDWDNMSEDEKKANADGFLKYYDNHGESDAKIDRKEFAEWLQEEIASFPDSPFDAVVQKLHELVACSLR